MRWILVIALVAPAGCAIRGASNAPAESLAPADVHALFQALTKRVKPGGPNHLHSRRLYYYSRRFAEAAAASVDSVQAAAILHDATKETGDGDPVQRFCSHGEQGSAYARETLEAIGKSDTFADHVARSILEHMGPCGYNQRFQDERFMSKYCAERNFPTPTSIEAKVLYDIDMLDLMTVDGVVKVVELRQGPGFASEPVADSARFGKDSAWKSVIDAWQTLHTRAARACGDDLVEHTRTFLERVDWKAVDGTAALKSAAFAYLRAHPLPRCLPDVPTCGAPASVAAEGSIGCR
jgi:hypothetical protein